MIIGHSNCEKGYKVYNISTMTITNGEPVWKYILTWRAGNKYNLNLLIIIWRAKLARIFFGFWRLKPADKWVWVTLLETDYFFHCAIEEVYFFFVKIRARNFFSKISQAPPQNIKWTVPKFFVAARDLKQTYILFWPLSFTFPTSIFHL